jgi:hypothetical protein
LCKAVIGLGHSIDSAGTNADRIFTIFTAGGYADRTDLEAVADKACGPVPSLAGIYTVVAVDAFADVHDEKAFIEVHDELACI